MKTNKLKKFLTMSLSVVAISSTLFTVNAYAAHEHTWEWENENIILTGHSTHQVKHVDSDGTINYEPCNIIVSRHTNKGHCTTCGETNEIDRTYHSHSHIDCPVRY